MENEPFGSINFLFDKSFEPYMTADQICEYFGTKNSLVASKAREIKDMLKIGHFDISLPKRSACLPAFVPFAGRPPGRLSGSK